MPDPQFGGSVDNRVPEIQIVSCPWSNFRMPPEGSYVIWRTMYETDRLPEGWVARAQEVDELWVPSDFNVETFTAAGVPREKLFVLAQPINTTRFPLRQTVDRGNSCFRFLSVFRWQYRKGWDILVRAYCSAFSREDDVCLVLHVLPLRDDTFAPARDIERVLGMSLGCTEAKIDVRTRPLASDEIPALYASADSFVLPSRGEGCGRPYLEAMASGLPTIGTRWSGNLAFMSDDNAMLIDASVRPVSPVEAEEWPLFAGQHWAEPSESHLRRLLRKAYETSPQERAALGERARFAVKRSNSIEVVEKRLIGHLRRISGRIRT